MAQPETLKASLVQTKGNAKPLPDPTEAPPIPTPAPVSVPVKVVEAPVSTGMTAMTMRLRPEVHRRLKVLAFNTEVPMAKMIEQAIDEYLIKHYSLDTSIF